LMGRSFCSRKSAVLAVRYESGFRERDRQGQHWRGMRSHGGFSKMIVCESQGYASGLAYDFFQILRRPTTSRLLRIYIYIRIYLKMRYWPGIDPAVVRLLTVCGRWHRCNGLEARLARPAAVGEDTGGLESEVTHCGEDRFRQPPSRGRWGLSSPPPAPAVNPASTDAGSPETGKVSGRRDGESGRPTAREGRSKPAEVETRHEARCAAREPGRCAAASRPDFTATELGDACQPHRHQTKAA